MLGAHIVLFDLFLFWYGVSHRHKHVLCCVSAFDKGKTMHAKQFDRNSHRHAQIFARGHIGCAHDLFYVARNHNVIDTQQ